MIFTVIYQNTPEIRANVIEQLLRGIEAGHNFGAVSARGRNFSTLPNWPDLATLTHLPLNQQCEELEYINKTLESRRQLVIEAEIITSAQNQEIITTS